MKAKVKEMIMMKKVSSEICDFIAKYLMKKYIFKTIGGKKMNDIFVYKDGVFIEKGKEIIERECENILEESAKTYTINEIKNKIERLTKINRNDLGCNNKNLVCMKNGVLDLETKKLMAHSEKYNFTNKIPINYVPEAFCDEIFKFLNDVLISEDIDCIQEWFGYQMFREYFIKKAVILRGIPDTGKTTFMNLLKAFVGNDNCSSVSLQLLAQGKWQLVPLYHKYSNICDDLSEKDITDSGTFKQVTGRSPIRAEIKFGDGFEFENYAKLTFACNKIPAINSAVDDQAYWDRWMIFDFESVFDKANIYTDFNIIARLHRSKELSGLFNWALQGLKRLQKRGYFSYRRDWEENRRIMLGESSSIARYSNECLLNETGYWTSNADLYDKYEEFCKLNNISVIETPRKFALDVRKFCNYGRFNSNKNNVFGVRNIKIISPLPVHGM